MRISDGSSDVCSSDLSKLDTYRTTHPTCSRRPAMSTETIDLTQLTGDYTIDASHSTLGFTARHAMVTKVRGAFNEFEGTVHADAADPSKSSAKITITAASIATRNADSDDHLKNNASFALDESH